MFWAPTVAELALREYGAVDLAGTRREGTHRERETRGNRMARPKVRYAAVAAESAARSAFRIFRGASTSTLARLLSLCFLALSALAAHADAATTYYWVSQATPDNAWASAANWSLTSGTAGGAGVPGAGDTAIFDGAGSYGNHDCNLSGAISVDTLTNAGGYSGALSTANNNLTVRLMTWAAGTFNAGTATVTVTGTGAPFVGGGTINAGGSTFKYAPDAAGTAWLPGFDYRKSHVINSATGAGTGYQVKVTVHYGAGSDSGGDVYLGGKCRTDFGDVRFASSDGSTQLSYWVESKTDSDNAVCWVKVADDLGSSRTIYAYYGNASAATASSGDATFVFFDDFSGDLSKWTKEKNGSYINIENGYLNCGGGQTSAPYAHTVLGSVATYSGFTDGVIQGKLNLSANGIAEISYRGNYGANTGYKSRADNRTGQGIGNLKPPYTDASWNFLAVGGGPSGTAIPSGSWLDFTVTVSGTSMNMTCNGQSLTGTDAQYSAAGEISLQNHYGAYSLYDDIRVRKYVSPEPSHAAAWGAEETLSPDVEVSTAVSYNHLTLAPSAAGHGFTLGTGGGQTLTVGGDLTVGDGSTACLATAAGYDPALSLAGGCTIKAGSVLTASSSSSFQVGGNWTNDGTFVAGTGTVTLNSSSGARTLGGAAGTTFYNLTKNSAQALTIGDAAASGKTVAVSNAFTWTDNDDTITVGNGQTVTFQVPAVTVAAGCTLASTGAGTIKTAGNWINDGTFTHGNGTVTLNASSGTQTVGGASNSSFYNLNLWSAGARQFGNNASARTFTVANTLSWVSGNLTVGQSGVADLLNLTGGSANLTVPYGCSLTTVGTAVVNVRGSTGTNGINILTGATLTLAALGTSSITCAGNFINNGTFTVNTSTVTLNASSGTQTVGGSSNTTFYNLTLSNAGARQFGNNAAAKTFTVSNTFSWSAGNLTVGQSGIADKLNLTVAAAGSNMTVPSGYSLTTVGTAVVNLRGSSGTNGINILTGSTLTLAAGGTSAISCGGNWTCAGTFTPNTSTVTFTSTSGTSTITSGGRSFYNLTCSGDGGTRQLQDTLAVGNDLDLVYGTFQFNGQNATITRDLICESTLAAGAVELGSGTIEVQRGLTVLRDQPFTQGTSTFRLTGTGTVSAAGFSTSFYNLYMAASGKTITIANPAATWASIAVYNTFTTGPGTITQTGAYWSGISVKYRTGGPATPIDMDAGTTFNAAGNSNVVSLGRTSVGDAGTFDFKLPTVFPTTSAYVQGFAIGGSSGGNLVFRPGRSTTIKNIFKMGDLSSSGGTELLDLNGFNLTVDGDLQSPSSGQSGMAVNVGNSVLTVNQDLVLDWCISSGLGYYLNIGATGQVVVGRDFFLNRSVNHKDVGIQMAAGAAISVGRNWDDSSYDQNAFVSTNGTVQFNGSGAQSISSNSLTVFPTATFTTATTATLATSAAFTNLSCTVAGKQFSFTAGTTQTVNGTLSLVGASGNNILLRSTAAARWTLNFPNGIQDVQYVDVEWGECSGNNCVAYDSTNSGNNDDAEASPRWVFAARGIRYWVGGTGNWDDPTNHWALSSGGSPGAGNAPDATMDVKFDANSGGGTATINAAASVYKFWMATGDTTAVTQDTTNTLTAGSGGYVQEAGTFTGGTGDITVNGAFTLSGGAFTSTQGELVLANVGTQAVTHSMTGGTFAHNDGTVHLNVAGAWNTYRDITLDWSMNPAFYKLRYGGAGGSANEYLRYILTGTPSVANEFRIEVDNANLEAIAANGGTIDLTGNLVLSGANRGRYSWNDGTTVVKVSSGGAQTYDTDGLGRMCSLEVANGSTFTAVSPANTFYVRDFTLTSGTFSAPSGTICVAGDFTYTAGTFTPNGGTLHFDAPVTWAATRNLTVNLNGASLGVYGLHFGGYGGSSNEAAHYVLGAADKFVADGDLTIQADGSGTSSLEYIYVDTGAVDFKGGLYVGQSSRAGTATLTATGGATRNYKTLEAGTGVLGSLVVNTPGGALNHDATGGTDFVVSGLTVTAGTFSAPTGTLTVGSGGYSQGGGAFAGGSGSIVVTGGWSLTNGTFTSTSGLLKFDAPNAARSYTQTGGTFTHASGSVEFENFGATDTIAFTNQLYDVVLDLTGSGSACSMASAVDVLHNFDVNHQGVNLGKWNVYGDITAYDTNGPVSGELNFLGASTATWTVSSDGERVPKVVISKAGGGSLAITNGINLYGDNTFQHVVGTVTMPTNFTMESGETRTQTVDASGVTFNNFIINMQGVASVANLNTVNIGGKLTFTSLKTANGTANLSGDLESNDADVSGTLAINCVGTGDQAVSCANGEFGDGALTVNKPVSGTVSLAEAFSPASWSGALNITAGTLDLAGYSVSTAGAFTIGASGTLKLLGSEAVTAATETYDTAGATVWFYGGAGPYVLTDLATSYSNLKITGAGGTFQFAGASTTTVSGTLTVAGTSGSNVLLRSAATPTKWAFSFPNGEQEVHYADVMDGECSDHDCYAYYSTNSGNNDDAEATPHWVFETAGIRYWVGGTGNWDDPTNHWALSSGGAPDAANAPDATTIVKFDANSGGGTLTINAAAAAYKFWMASGNTTSVTQDAANALTVDVGGMVVAAGTFTGGSGAITDGGDFCLSGGSFTSTSGTLSLAASFAVTGGTFTHNSGTVTFTATSGTETITSAAQPFYNATFGTAAGGTWQLQDALSVANDFTFAYGTFQTNDKDVTIGRDLLLQSTLGASAFAAGAATVSVGRHLNTQKSEAISRGTSQFNLTGTGDISCGNGCDLSFYNLKVAYDAKTTTYNGTNSNTEIRVYGQVTTGTGTFAYTANGAEFQMMPVAAQDTPFYPDVACTWQVPFTIDASSQSLTKLYGCNIEANVRLYRNINSAHEFQLMRDFAMTGNLSAYENQGPGALQARTILMNGWNLSVTGNVSLGTGTTPREYTINVSSGTLTITGNLTAVGTTNHSTKRILDMDGGTAIIGGNFTHLGYGEAGQKIYMANDSTLRVGGSWDTSAYAANAIFDLTGTNLVKFDGDDAATINCIATESWPNVEVAGSLATMQQNLTCQGLKMTSGSLDMNDFVLTVPYGASNKVDLVGGTIVLGSATHEISGGWEYSGGTITPESSTVRFWLYTASPGPTISGTFSLANVTFQAGTVNDQNYYTNLTATLTVDGTLTLNGNELGYISDGMARIMGGGIVYAKGNIVGNGKTISGNLRLTVNGNGDQEQTNLSWSCSKNSARYLVDKPGGTFTWKTAMDFRSAWFAGAIDGNPQVQFNTPVLCEAGLPLTVEVTGYTNVAFIYGAGGGSGLTVGSLTVTLCRNYDGNTYWDMGGKTVAVTGTTTIKVSTAYNYSHRINNGTLDMQGDLVFNQSGSHSITTGSATLTMTGSSDATASSTGNTEVYSQSITINKDAGKKVSLATNLKLLGASTDLTVTQGILDLGGRDLTLGRNLVVTDTLRLQGAETVTCTALDLQNGSTVDYYGTGTYAAFPAWLGNSYKNLAFSGSGTWQPAAAVTVAEGLAMTAGTYEVLDTRSLTVTGDTALSGTSTLRLDGGGTLGIGGGSTLSSAAGSTFQVAGAADKIAQIQNDGSGYYDLHLSGNVNVRYARIDDLAANCVTLDGAGTTTFDNVEFNDGEAAVGPYIKVLDSAWNSHNFTGMAFEDVGGGRQTILIDTQTGDSVTVTSYASGAGWLSGDDSDVDEADGGGELGNVLWAPTAADGLSASAEPAEKGTLVAWTAPVERGTLGYRVLRREAPAAGANAKPGEWQRLAEVPAAAFGGEPTGNEYRWLDESTAGAGAAAGAGTRYEYRVEEVEAGGELPRSANAAPERSAERR